MKIDMKLATIKQRSVEVIKKHLPQSGWRLCLFGSQASGTATPTSDVDIAIIGDRPVPWKIMVAIREDIDVIPTLRSIDVVDVCSADEGFRENILAQGQMLA